jgi:hypothetical protein
VSNKIIECLSLSQNEREVGFYEVQVSLALNVQSLSGSRINFEGITYLKEEHPSSQRDVLDFPPDAGLKETGLIRPCHFQVWIRERFRIVGVGVESCEATAFSVWSSPKSLLVECNFAMRISEWCGKQIVQKLPV